MEKSKGLRDIITHQYFDVNAEAIYDVCEEKIPKLILTVSAILDDIRK